MANQAYYCESRQAQQIGRQIEQHREARGWTKRDLAARMGVDAAQVSRWERGSSVPPLARLLRLAEIFHAELIDFLLTTQEVGVGARLRRASELSGPAVRAAVVAVFEAGLAVATMEGEKLEAVLGALAVVEGTSRASGEKKGPRGAF
jgi:transcriptional regulator with XRE-family HTH domain